jgi:hypothetical protein
MRSIHFRVEDDLYLRIQEEANQQDLSIASFARVATVARTLLWGVRRGAPWADTEKWGEALGPSRRSSAAIRPPEPSSLGSAASVAAFARS